MKTFKELKKEDFIHIAKLSYYDGNKQKYWDKISTEPEEGHKCGFRKNLVGKDCFTVKFLKEDKPVWCIEIYDNLDIHSMGYDGSYKFQPVSNQLEIFNYLLN